jgi:MFS family permease
MYAIDWTGLLTRTHRNCSACASCPHTERRTTAASRFLPTVSSTVWALGLTSLFTDVSSEMIASVLPMYLVLQLGMQPLAYGVIDGLYQGAAALVRVAAGVAADRLRRYKEVAAVGYALSALCRPALLVAGSAWMAIAGIVAVDRVGKGIRTAPRDALISMRSPCRDLATAFGVHRALDAAGAMLGPLVAFLVLALMPRRFDVLFAVSFAMALVGVGVILLCVEPASARAGQAVAPVSTDRARDLFASPRFRAIVFAGFVLGLPTMSDGFIFLSLQNRLQMGVTAFPLFYVATSLFTATGAVPMGRLADRFGRTKVLIGGYVLLAAVYVTLLAPIASVALAVVSLVLFGAYYAATDGVLTAMAAAVLPPSASGTGLSLLATATNVSRLAASVLFGLLWTSVGIGAATVAYVAALAVAIVAAIVVLVRAERSAPASDRSALVTASS